MTGYARNLRRGATALALLLVVGGCPKRFDPRAETVRASPNPEADHEYQEARARLEVGDAREAEARFAAFLHKHPNDPLAPSARIGQARAALLLDQPKKARRVLEPLAHPSDDPTAARARYLLGLALHQTRDYARSRELLTPFVDNIASGDDATELHAVLADDAAHLGDTGAALSEYDAFFARARPVEKLYLRDRVSDLVGRLSSAEALKQWDTLPHDGLAAAYLGKRLAADARAQGNEQGAAAYLDQSRGARARAGLDEPVAAPAATGKSTTVALIVPLSGRQRALGERVLRGALLAADLLATDGLQSGGPLELLVRDTGSDPSRAVAAVDELAQAGVAALVGAPDRAEAQSAVPRAERLGLPFLELAPDAARRGQSTFKLVRQSDDRARTLARLAIKRGARTVAVLAPESAYGRALAAAFVEEAHQLGARTVADVRYPEGSTTFVEPVRRLRQAAPQALFVPSPASDLALIAPQLAASGVTHLPGVKPTRHEAVLYATADGMNERFVQSTAKYLEGAVLAPVFYADQSDASAAAFLTRYRQAYGEDPSSLDALAYDAVRAARLALEKSDGNRGAVAASLSRLTDRGLSGELAFTAGGDRGGAPPLYTVEEGAVRALK